MSVSFRFALACAVALAASAARADTIAPGLWQITSRTESGGVLGPALQSSKCLTVAETHDVPTTFSPVPRTINSTCAPIVRSFDGERLNWKLTCKGQLDMELTGEFHFDNPHHYTATVRTVAAMAGTTMVDSKQMLDAKWVSECR